MGHKLQFPAVLTYCYACDVRVICLLRQRGLGNSATQLQRKLTEQHSERWLLRKIRYRNKVIKVIIIIQYLNDCANTSGMLLILALLLAPNLKIRLSTFPCHHTSGSLLLMSTTYVHTLRKLNLESHPLSG